MITGKIKYCLKVILLISLPLLFLSFDTADPVTTDGKVDFTVKTVTYNGDRSPKNILAIWVEDISGKFVKTLLLRADQRKQWLLTWNIKSGGNTVDAITGATLSSHQTHTQGPMTSVSFTKGPENSTVTPADVTNFINMNLKYTVRLSTDATLSLLLVDGIAIEGFNPAGLSYDVMLPAGKVTMPAVTATPADPNAKVKITDAADLPGTTVAEVTAEDGETIIAYTINFSLEPSGLSTFTTGSIMVYPTVSRDVFTVITGGGPSTISVYDLAGSMVTKIMTSQSETVISAPGPGIYILRVDRGKEVAFFRIVRN
jgi:hypothetical protein